MTTTAVAIGRARMAVIVATAAIAAASWAYLTYVASRMGHMSSILAMPMTSSWTGVQTGLMAIMWMVMMAAMMLPSAIPMVAAYERMDRLSPSHQRGSTAAFVVGYLVVWATFATAATGLQWALQHAGLVDGMGAATQSGLAGAFLVAAGAFQLTPVKRRTLQACRTPMGFLGTSWRNGAAGALRMGLHHGITCFGCCVMLMMMLFVLGVMNLLWVAALTIFVLVEKVSSRGAAVSTLSGIAMIAWGLAAIAFVY